MTGDTGVLLQLLVDHLRHLWRNDLRQGGGAQLLHGVVLDGSPGQVRIGLESELIDGSDERGKILFVVGIRHHLTKLIQLG